MHPVSVRPLLALACCALLAACGAPPDAPADAGDVDAGKPDAGTVDAGQATLGAPGAPCEADDDCAGNEDALCIRTVAGGYCAIVGCNVDTNLGCPDDSLCVALDDTTNACLEGPCEGDSANCSRRSEGFSCLDDLNICWNYDYSEVNPDGTAIGTACESDDTCASGFCLPSEYDDGAPTGYPGGYCSFSCNEDAAVPCPSGSTCSGGYCLDACSGSDACREGFVCSGGLCRRDVDTVPLGTPCEDYTACDWGDCVPEVDPDYGAFLTGFPGGYCTVYDACDPGTSGGCGANGTCVEAWYGGTICAKSCTDSTSCREGYQCIDGGCLRPPSTVAGVDLGAPCTTDTECDTVEGSHGFCVRDADPEFPYFTSGYCVALGCTPADPTQGTVDTCASAGGTCYAISEYAIASFCLKSCGDDTDCRVDDSYACDGDNTCWPSDG